MKHKMMELYLHIPFCIRKCSYCDFLSFPADGEAQRRYADQLMEEIRIKSAAFEDREITTLFLGGGTPSILKEGLIGEIMDRVRERFHVSPDAEATLEANPGTLTMEKLLEYREAGISRLSLGLQSADNEELQNLGRIHTWEEFLESFHLARQAGFDRINVDLMSALPGQTVSSWERTLRRVTDLGPEHISAYSLIVEEGTPFYERYSGAGACLLPDEDAEREMYRAAGRILKCAGYDRYEISNYARPGQECRHNVGYWTGAEYLGLGLGASSYIDGWRFSNTGRMDAYLAADETAMKDAAWYDSAERTTETSRMEEFMFLGLRMMRGVSKQEFSQTFGRTMEAVYGSVLEKMERLGLMEQCGGNWRLTEAGIDVSNLVMSEFLL